MLIAQELDCAGERIASLAMVSAFERLVLAHTKRTPSLWYSAAELSSRGSRVGYLTGRNPALARAAICSIIRLDAVLRHFTRKMCKKQAYRLVKVVLCRCVMDRYRLKLIFVVKEIAVFIECAVLDIRCDDGIERQIIQTVVGLGLVIIFFESIQNIGIIVPHCKILSQNQTKAELLGANIAECDMQKAKSLFPARNNYIRPISNYLRF